MAHKPRKPLRDEVVSARLVAALAESETGLSKNEIHKEVFMFGTRAAQLDRVVAALVAEGRVTVSTVVREIVVKRPVVLLTLTEPPAPPAG